jgi:hypothetical protein
MRRATRRLVPAAVLGLLIGAAGRAEAGIIITPTFDSSITSDPNAAAIEGAIQGAINDYQARFTDPITVNITFREMTSGLGQSNFSLFSLPYATARAALAADATTSDDATALAHLPAGPNNPVTNTADMLLKPANIKALGITGISLPSSDGTIGLNTHLTDVGSPGTTGQFSLRAVAQHEIDEILGLGSTLGLGLGAPFDNDPSTEDLYRYDASGNRSFTTDGTAKAFFSIDGTTDLAQFDNQNDGGDFGDWQSNPLPPGVAPKVQDAFATVGAHPTLGVELRALDVIGYDLAPAAVAVPEPSTLAGGAIGVLLALGWAGMRRRAGAAD